MIKNPEIRLKSAFDDFISLFVSEDKLDPESNISQEEKERILLEHAKTASSKNHVSLEALLEKVSIPIFVLKELKELKDN